MAGIFEKINRMVGSKDSEALAKKHPDGPRVNPGLETWMEEAKGSELKGETSDQGTEFAVAELKHQEKNGLHLVAPEVEVPSASSVEIQSKVVENREAMELKQRLEAALLKLAAIEQQTKDVRAEVGLIQAQMAVVEAQDRVKNVA